MGVGRVVKQPQMAQRAGFEAVAISDHVHPGMDSQGQAPFVWSTIGGVAATTDLEVTTAVMVLTTTSADKFWSADALPRL